MRIALTRRGYITYLDGGEQVHSSLSEEFELNIVKVNMYDSKIKVFHARLAK